MRKHSIKIQHVHGATCSESKRVGEVENARWAPWQFPQRQPGYLIKLININFEQGQLEWPAILVF